MLNSIESLWHQRYRLSCTSEMLWNENWRDFILCSVATLRTALNRQSWIDFKFLRVFSDYCTRCGFSSVCGMSPVSKLCHAFCVLPVISWSLPHNWQLCGVVITGALLAPAPALLGTHHDSFQWMWREDSLNSSSEQRPVIRLHWFAVRPHLELISRNVVYSSGSDKYECVSNKYKYVLIVNSI